jgi:hypothetical protein
MPSTGAARAKVKFPPADATITVANGQPSPEEVQVPPEATVQFVNDDTSAYRVRLWTRAGDKHADIDVLLPARAGITVMVDPETTSTGECYYDLIPTTMYAANAVVAALKTRNAVKSKASSKSKSKAAPPDRLHVEADTSTGGGSGGGTIKIGGH